MKILLTGGTGFIGQELLKALCTHSLVILTRDVGRAKQSLAYLNAKSIEYVSTLDDFDDLNQFDAVINLAGEPIADKRWTEKQKTLICRSRWDITEQLVALIHASTEPPHTFISGSAVGYYGDQQAHPFDECLKVNRHDFTHHVCRQWEELAGKAHSENTRVVLLRTGIVLAPNGGALKKMLLPYKLGLGGPIGSGEQYMPWIHMLDMIRAIVFLLETEHAHGPFNLSSPHPVPNTHFSRQLAKTLKRPHFLFTPKWALSAAMGESACLLFDSLRAKPKKLTELGFVFSYSRLEPALRNLLQHAN